MATANLENNDLRKARWSVAKRALTGYWSVGQYANYVYPRSFRNADEEYRTKVWRDAIKLYYVLHFTYGVPDAEIKRALDYHLDWGKDLTLKSFLKTVNRPHSYRKAETVRRKQ